MLETKKNSDTKAKRGKPPELLTGPEKQITLTLESTAREQFEHDRVIKDMLGPEKEETFAGTLESR